MYDMIDSQKCWMNYASELAGSTRRFSTRFTSKNHIIGSKVIDANLALIERVCKDYTRNAWNIDDFALDNGAITVKAKEIHSLPFCKLIEFKRYTDNQETLKKINSQPSVLIVAPLSGHFATLLHDTVATMLIDHKVFITDWEDAKNVPIVNGSFGLDTYVDYIRSFINILGTSINVIAVCQSTVPVFAAVSLMASEGEKLPLTLTLMAGPIDPSINQTEVGKYAEKKSIKWYGRNLIHRVPQGYLGEGRRVLPGFLQLFSFVSMNPKAHIGGYLKHWYNVWKENDDAIEKHEKFYDEYNSVLDMDERFYLETIEEIFHKFSIPKGKMIINGKLVKPEDIKNCKLLIIEGAKDDIVGVGQTFAAHKLCTGIIIKKYLLVDDVGHYGVFSGKKWREKIYPKIREFIR